MAETQDISILVRRIRAGDDKAAEELLERYGNVFLRTVRLRLENTSMRRLVDSEDIRQSVFGSLFVRLRLGQYELSNDRDLINLLFKMAHNKLTAKQRRQRHEPKGGMVDSELRDPGPTPSEVLGPKELLHAALRRLKPDEQRILELRDQGAEWEAVAHALGGTAEARRKQWERASERVAQELDGAE